MADYVTLINQGKLIFTGSMEDLSANYRLIKGKPKDLIPELEKSIAGLRKTEMGFEGLISTKEAARYKQCVLDEATIDNIVIGISKGGVRK